MSRKGTRMSEESTEKKPRGIALPASHELEAEIRDVAERTGMSVRAIVQVIAATASASVESRVATIVRAHKEAELARQFAALPVQH